MKISIFTNNEAKYSIDVDENVEVRLIEDKIRIRLKLRNNIFKQTGRLFNWNWINSINKIQIDNDEYRVIYVSHEHYYHSVEKSETQTDVLVEDIMITFDKGGVKYGNRT